MNDELDGLVLVSTKRSLDDYLALFKKRSGTRWYTRGDLRHILYDIKSLPDEKEQIQYKTKFKEVINRYNLKSS